MNGFIQYILLSTASISITYLFYILWISKGTHFKYQRIFLICSILISLMIPLNRFSIKLSPADAKQELSVQEKILDENPVHGIINEEKEKQIVSGETVVGHMDKTDIKKIILSLYFVIMIIFLFRYTKELVLILYYYFISKKEYKFSYTLVYNKRFNASFSFFRWIFINRQHYSDEDIHEIIKHERVHASQFHSADVLLVKLLSAVMWFNPVIWIMKKSVLLVHEYLADEGALSTGIDKLKYQVLLVNQVAEERLIRLTSSFNHSLIKKRIVMMTKPKLSQKTNLKVLAIFPIAAIIFIGVACVNGQIKQQNSQVVTAVSPVKMNVLYLGAENPIEVAVSGYEKEDIRVEIDNGEITGDKGIYIVKPEKKGTALFTVYANNEVISRNEFRVKTIPDPVASVGKYTGGKIEKEELLKADKVNAYMLYFDFDLTFEVVEFTVSVSNQGQSNEVVSDSDLITNKQKQLIKEAGNGQKVYFENIKCIAPDGSKRNLGTLVFEIR